MPRTRDLARIDYSKLNAKGFDSDSFEMDVLNSQDELFQARCFFFGNQCGNDMNLKHEKLFLLNNQ
jgi:hypothetical protein